MTIHSHDYSQSYDMTIHNHVTIHVHDYSQSSREHIMSMTIHNLTSMRVHVIHMSMSYDYPCHVTIHSHVTNTSCPWEWLMGSRKNRGRGGERREEKTERGGGKKGRKKSTLMAITSMTIDVMSSDMGWLWLVGSLTWQFSFAKEPYKRDDIRQKRRIIWRGLLIVATPRDEHIQFFSTNSDWTIISILQYKFKLRHDFNVS